MNRRQKKKSMFPVKEKKICKQLTKKYGKKRCHYCTVCTDEIIPKCKKTSYYSVYAKKWSINKMYLTRHHRKWLKEMEDYYENRQGFDIPI